MTKARTLADLLDSSGDVKSSALDNATSSLSDLSVTATASELNTLDGITATTAELNLMDGVTATTAEINYLDGVTSNVQTQIDGISSEVVDDTTPSLGGDLSTNGNDINFGDNDKAQFGAGDLQIYHDGSNSYITDAGTGNLKIQGSGQVRIEDDSGNVGAVFNANTDAVLKYAGENKLVTTSDGIEAMRGSSDGIIQSWRRGTTEVMKLHVESTDNVFFSAMQGGGAGLIFWGGGGTDPIINPAKEGVQVNGEVQLGRSSERFKNLYLSGEGGSTAAVDVRQGCAKAWGSVRFLSSKSTRDSYNLSSYTDQGTGNFICYINNDMDDANYSISLTSSGVNTTYFGISSLLDDEDRDAGHFDFECGDLAKSGEWYHTVHDPDFSEQQVFGDLA